MFDHFPLPFGFFDGSMPHPDDQTLWLFLDARLETEQEERIEEHLEQCLTCTERVTQMERSRKDPFLQGLKGVDLKNTDDNDDDDLELPTEPVPEFIGNYTILGVLGSGGMGTVYRAINPHLNRPAAVKVIKASRVLRPSSAERFQRELLAIGKLKHPNIVEAFDAGVYEDRPYLAMELLEGDDLARYVQQNGSLPVKEASDIICQAALGLQHAHEAGLVHRDIKPSNLFRTKVGTVKILDLGLARLLETESTELNSENNNPTASPDATAEGQILGSPDYMSPEQAVNAKSVDVRSDLYSLGCTFFYLLTETPPFGETTHPELADKIEAHSKQDLPPIEQFRKDVPPAIRNLLYRMTAKRQDDRPQSAKEVTTILERYLQPAWKRYATLALILFVVLAATVGYGFLLPEPIILPPERIEIPVEVPVEVPVEKLPELTFDWKPVRTITTGISPANSAFFTSDGNGIIEGRSSGDVFLHDVATGKQLVTFEQVYSPLNSVAMSWDRTLFVGGCQNGFVHIWNMMSGKLVEGFRFSEAPVISIALSMDSSRLFMATNHHARVWRIADGETFKTMELENGANIDQSLFTPDGRSIICCKNRGITVLDSSGFLETSNKNLGNRVSDLKLSPGLDYLTLIETTDCVKLFPRIGDEWEYGISSDNADIKTIRSPGYSITCAAISADTRVLATAEKNATGYLIRLWNLDSETVGQTISLETANDTITSLDFSPDANRLLARSGESLIIFEKSKSSTLSWSFAPPPAQIPIEEVTEPFAPKTKFEKKSQIYGGWKIDQSLSGTPGDPKDAYFVSNGREIVYMQSNGVFHRQSKSGGQSGKVVPSPATAFVLSNDERLFAFAGTKRLNDPISDSEGRITNRYTEIRVVHVCDTEKRRVVHTIAPESMGKERITSLAFSLDAKRLFIGGRGGEMWTLPGIVDEHQTGQNDVANEVQDDKSIAPNIVLKIPRDQGVILSSAFSPDGSEIVFGTDQGELHCCSTLKNGGRKAMQSFSGQICCMKYGNDFGRLYVVDGTNKITVFSWNKHVGFTHRSEEDIEYPRQDAKIQSIACCRDNEHLLVGGEGILDLCNIKKRFIETSLPLQGVIHIAPTTESVIALDYAPDGTKIFERQTTGAIRIWKNQFDSKTTLPPTIVPEQVSLNAQFPIVPKEKNSTPLVENDKQATTRESSLSETSPSVAVAANKSEGSVVYLPEIPSVIHTVAMKQDEKIRDGERNRFTLRQKLEREGTTIHGDWYFDKVFSESRGELDSAFFVRDGTDIIDAQSDGFIRIWHVDGTQGTRFPAGGPVSAVARSKDGRSLHFGTATDRRTKLLSNNSLLRSAVFNDRRERHHLMTVDSRNGSISMNQLISLGKDHIRNSGEDMGPITTISVSPDGQKIFFGGKISYIWPLGEIGRISTQDKRTFVLGHIIASAFSPDASEIYFADSKQFLYRFSCERNSSIRELEPPLRFENNISSLKLSPDFACLGIAYGTNKITLIPLRTLSSGGENVGVGTPNLLHFQRLEIEFDLPNRIYCCAFSPEGGFNHILAGGDGVI